MEITLVSTQGTWRDIADNANNTVGKEAGTKEPSSAWKKRMLLSEHSPIRSITFTILMKDIPYWVSVHLVRHKVGIEHFVQTQRSDRTGVPRDELPQGALVNHRIVLNPQAMITISRKRLCKLASEETRAVWQEVVATLKGSQKELYEACVPDCLYRGRCYEMKSCGWDKTEEFEENLKDYGT